MPSSPPSFIRYFAATDDGPTGKIALEYVRSLVRIAPVRIISMTGALVGGWRAFEAMLMTPMTGTYASAVCCHPSRWVWLARVPMTDKNESGAKISEYAEGTEELYTPKVRNVLFMADMPSTIEQLKSAKRYEAVICPSLTVPGSIAARWPEIGFEGTVVGVPVENHTRIREAVLGAP